MEIKHEPSWYDKEDLANLTSTQLSFFDEFHIQKFSGLPVTIKVNEHNIRFTIDEEGIFGKPYLFKNPGFTVMNIG